ncbi:MULTISPECIES: CoA transferase [Salipiger]|uniref:CoA-transferase family III n=1 Tax=Salipiger profundus TaxID=1229727 RepID=A0A1U7DDF9_9RHOB|nr:MULTISPECIES: CoA transferase [Salipiger]APX26163.1 CoA-transferase family III [Salipiger profundus]GGA23526.1 hypothetical protein GCM10011326_39910 [Salipiger profundus]
MKILITGQTAELRLLADLLRKLGNDVSEGAPAPGHDVLVWSSEVADEATATQIAALDPARICDISGGTDPLAPGGVLDEQALQAVAGLVDTTGFPGGPPTRTPVPFVAISTALHAACAILAQHLGGDGGRVEVSRYLAAVTALTTFLPAGLLGREASRIGNAHPASSPWNGYPASDGWVLICTSKDDQWRKLCQVADYAPLNDPGFAVQSDRIARRAEVDGLLSDWTRGLTAAECARRLGAVGVPSGPILTLLGLANEPNVALRQPEVVRQLGMGGDPFGAAQLFQSTPWPETKPTRGWETGTKGPLSGLKVVEIGQFTTVPLAGRHLVHLGADVLKIEPPGGEPARSWAPLLDGLSHYYTITNSGKQVVQLDMRDPDRMAWLRDRIAEADVLVENMRPGVLAQFGLTPEALSRLNPRLVAVSVSGFGAHSAYPGRAAFDTVIQGMSGIMDLTRAEGQPVKLGISAADILGAQVALLAVLSALTQGEGCFVDLAMQDVGVYAALASDGSAVATVDVPIRTVREIAQNPAFQAECLTTIPDEQGLPRAAVRMPYQLHPGPARMA